MCLLVTCLIVHPVGEPDVVVERLIEPRSASLYGLLEILHPLVAPRDVPPISRRRLNPIIIISTWEYIKQAPTHADPEILSIWQENMLIPCVAIGGITVDNCRPLVAAGADFLAVSAGVWGYPAGPAAAVRAFNSEIATGMDERSHSAG